MKNVVRSTRVVRTPETDASGRFCMTARIRRPAGVRCMYDRDRDHDEHDDADDEQARIGQVDADRPSRRRRGTTAR